MSEKEIKQESVNPNDALANMTNEEIKNELVSQLLKKAKTKKNVLTYSDMADYLDSFDLDKTLMDDIYDTLMSKDVEITSETEPEEFAPYIDADEDENIDEEDDGIIMSVQ